MLEAAHKARSTGQGQRLEYRIRHKDGSWRILESTASAVRNAKGKTEKLVIVNRDISERKRAEEMLAHSAFHDGLTNLPNRALFLDRLQRALVLSKRHTDYKFAVLFIDVDEFKVFNDSLGHKVGDEVLIQIGLRLTASLREVDTIARPQFGQRTRTIPWPGSAAMNTPSCWKTSATPATPYAWRSGCRAGWPCPSPCRDTKLW